MQTLTNKLIVAIESSQVDASVKVAGEIYNHILNVNYENAVRLILAADVNRPTGRPGTSCAVRVIHERTCEQLNAALAQAKAQCIIVQGLYQCHLRDEGGRVTPLPVTPLSPRPDLLIYVANDAHDYAAPQFLSRASSHPFKHCMVLFANDPHLLERILEKIAGLVRDNLELRNNIWIPGHVYRI